jgi:hypothetical protein
MTHVSQNKTNRSDKIRQERERKNATMNATADFSRRARQRASGLFLANSKGYAPRAILSQ